MNWTAMGGDDFPRPKRSDVDAVEMARVLGDLFRELKGQGFTEGQAMQVILEAVRTGRPS